jgi:hypothetical protein
MHNREIIFRAKAELYNLLGEDRCGRKNENINEEGYK